MGEKLLLLLLKLGLLLPVEVLPMALPEGTP